MKTNTKKFFWDLAYHTIQELETDNGILASGKEEIFGCIFGRDSLITCLKLIRTYEKTKDEYFIRLAYKILINIRSLQGNEINIESGEEPGKCIHEFRPNNHEHLTKNLDMPWYVYPDNVMRNYDTVDATSLFLIAAHRYYQTTLDVAFLNQVLPNVKKSLSWIKEFGDSNHDGFIDYKFNTARKHGGLKTQSWMDSAESIFHEQNNDPTSYPIAPVEVQAYTYLALKLWAKFFEKQNIELSDELYLHSYELKTKFNSKFVLKDHQGYFLAAAIDGNGQSIGAIRSSMGHCLWACISEENGLDCIVDQQYISDIVKRLLSKEMFVAGGGIRTLSSKSSHYDPYSYHNGSIWPHDNSIIAEGLENFGYCKEANQVRKAMLQAFKHFKTPIELFVYTDKLEDYIGPVGHGACKKQAWSAAGILSEFASVN